MIAELRCELVQGRFDGQQMSTVVGSDQATVAQIIEIHLMLIGATKTITEKGFLSSSLAMRILSWRVRGICKMRTVLDPHNG